MPESFKMVLLFEVHDLPYYVSVLGYVGIFLFFITVDQITPIPEEISLLTIGYFSSQGVFNPFLAGIVALVAFLTVDTAYFFILKAGKKWGKKLQKKMEKSFFKTLKEKFTDHFPRAIFVICFIPRMRLWAPMISSVLQIPYSRFIKYDAISLASFTALYIAIGLFFHKGLNAFMAKLQAVQNIIFLGVMLIIAAIIIMAIRKRRKERSQ
jgi:membrane protein DedA with SNARE-associated domain